jgi:hypothetical protein
MPEIENRFTNITEYETTVNPDQEALKARIADLKFVAEATKSAIQSTGVLDEQNVHNFFRLMSTNYVRLRVPILFWTGQLLGFIEEGLTTNTIPVDIPSGEAIVAFLKHPVAHVRKIYPSLQTETDAQIISYLVFIPAAILLGHFIEKVSKPLHIGQAEAASFGWIPAEDSATPNGDQLLGRAFSFSFKGSSDLKGIDLQLPDPCDPPEQDPIQSLESEVTVTCIFVPRDHFGSAGLFVSFAATEQVQRKLGENWKLVVGPESGGAANFFFGEGGVVADGPAGLTVSASIEHLKKAEEEPEVIPLSATTRLELGHLSFLLEGSAKEFKAVARATDCALVMARDLHPVTERALPSSEIHLDFDLGLGFADGRFFFEGAVGLELTLPGAKTLGPLTVQALSVRLIPGGGESQADLSFEVLATFQLKFGAFLITVQKMGLGGEIDFFDDFRFGLRGPEILGILISSKVVKGGGFLGHSPTTGDYFGGLELTINEMVSVKAIAVIGTKMPDGSRGFSFAAIITVSDFPGINLGFGFRLTGVGGIIGLDRTFDIVKLEEKLKQGVLRNLLFPPDPVANATAILADIGAVFPAARDHSVFGLMFRICWGTEKLVIIDLAVIIAERIAVLGIVDVYFPRLDYAVVEVHVHVMADLDRGRKRLFARAEIINTSHIYNFKIKGSAAMLLTWGDDPVFILSFGGFNKRYQSNLPDGFPELNRLTIQLANSKRLQLTMYAYLAITSNSFQIGGGIQLKAGVSKFTIEGSLSVDALINFYTSPTFILDLDARLALKAWGVNLFTVHVEGTLSGGSPWHARGSATFSIWGFGHSVDFDEVWGDPADETTLPDVAVASELIAAFKDDRNWLAELPLQAEGLVTLRSLAPDEAAIFHPLSGLAVSQRVAPLNITLTRFGNARPQGQTRFSIEEISVGSGSELPNIAPIKEPFARSQFLEMTEDEKLQSPAFEKMDSGVRVGTGGMTHSVSVTKEMRYQTRKYNGEAHEFEPDSDQVVSHELLEQLLASGSAAAAPSAVKMRAPAPRVKVASFRYTVAEVSDQSPVIEQEFETYSEALELMRKRIASRPSDRTRLQILEVV